MVIFMLVTLSMLLAIPFYFFWHQAQGHVFESGTLSLDGFTGGAWIVAGIIQYLRTLHDFPASVPGKPFH